MTDTYSTPDDTGELRSSELSGSLGERLGAQFGEAFMGGSRVFNRMREYRQAEAGEETLGSQIGRLQQGEDLNDVIDKPAAPIDVPIADAKARIKQQGLDTHLTLPDQPTIRQGVLDLMLAHAQERRDHDAAVSRGPQGFFTGALGMVTEIGAGMIDPVNIAAFSIPVLGEARWGQMLLSAGDSLAARAGVKAVQGGLQGAVGSAALVPGDWWLHTKDGQDYTMADALKSVVMGAGMGAAFHAGAGSIGDLLARSRGRPLPGSPEDLVLRGLMHGTHVPGAALESEGLPEEEIPGIAATPPDATQKATPNLANPIHPAEILADLPPAAREDVARAAIADIINDRPVRVAELLAEAAKEDPRIAESVGGVEAFHGSPHDFDRFDSSKIGAGEGAQSYGHGLYFAENEAVARDYRNKLANRANFDIPYPPDVEAKYGPQLAKFRAEDDRINQEIADRANAGGTSDFSDLYQQQHSNTKAWDAVLQQIEDEHPSGRLYKVHIAADREHFLDWDKPLSEQPQILAKISPELRDELEDMFDRAGLAADLEPFSGRELYQLINKKFEDPKLASEFAREAGIPGIKYLDQGSRRITDAEIRDEIERIKETEERAQKFGQAAAPGSIGWTAAKAAIARWEAQIGKPATHNFVVFDDKLIRITHKNGQEVGLDAMKAAQPESVPGPAPGTLRTGRPNVDALLHDPIVADAIANGPVDRAHDVPYEAGASEGRDPTTHLDHHLPRLVELKSGSFDPAIPAKIHEQVEKRAMELLIAKKLAPDGRVLELRQLSQKEINEVYEIAHHEYAEVAEDAWYRSQGLDIDEVNAWWAKQDKITEHENPKNPPPNLYKKPYPHNQVEGVKHEEKGAAAEWPTGTAVEGANSAGAGDNVVPVRARKASGPRARPEETRSLFEHIAANGGLRDDDPMIPDVKSSLGRDNHFVPGFGNLIRKPGQLSTAAARSGARAPMSLDQARESAVHAGYLEDHGEHSGGLSTSSVRDLLDAVDHEARGNRVYRRGAEPPKSARDQAQHEHELNGAMDKALGDYGVDLDRIPSKTRARTLEIMDREGVTDPLDAYERAVMEETQHGAQAGEHERIPETIPGWDLPDDAGAAPGAGAAAQAGGERSAGGPARDAGQGDRAAGRAGPAAARGVADWSKLSDARDAVDDPEAVEASHRADATPEPKSIDPTKAPTAAEAAAKEADQLLADILPTLSDAEKKVFEDALAKVEDDRAAREEIVRDGAACLAEAAA